MAIATYRPAGVTTKMLRAAAPSFADIRQYGRPARVFGAYSRLRCELEELLVAESLPAERVDSIRRAFADAWCCVCDDDEFEAVTS